MFMNNARQEPSMELINGQANDTSIITTPATSDVQLIQPIRATLLSSNGYATLEQVANSVTPQGTATHKVFSHYDVIQKEHEILARHKVGVTNGRYALTDDGMRFYWTERVDLGFPGGAFTIGGRNSHDKSFPLQLVGGLYVFICENGVCDGSYKSIMRKHTKNANLNESLVLGIDEILSRYEPMAAGIQRWRNTQISDQEAKVAICDAYAAKQADLPLHLMRPTYEHYFNPQYEEFMARNAWSLQNAFTSAIKVLDPIPQQKAQAAIGEFFRNKKF